MKKILAITLLALLTLNVSAQTRKVKAKDLGGLWQLKIEIKEGTFDKEADNEDNFFARAIIQFTGNMVEGILDGIDVKFEFLADGKCKVYSSGFGSDTDVDYTEWSITKDGELYIKDNDHFESSEDNYWLFEGDVLVQKQNNGHKDDDANVYLVRID